MWLAHSPLFPWLVVLNPWPWYIFITDSSFFVDFLSPFEVWVQGAVLHSCCNCHTLPSLHSNTEANIAAAKKRKRRAEQQLSVSELKHYCRCKDNSLGEWNSLLTWNLYCASIHVSRLRFTFLWMSTEGFIGCKTVILSLRSSFILRLACEVIATLNKSFHAVLKDWNICDKRGWRQGL